MWELLRRNPLAVVLATLIHVAVIAFMLVGVDWLKAPKPKQSKVEVVQARVVDEKQMQAELAKLQAAKDKKAAEAETARKREQQRLADLEKRREQEKRKLAKLEQERKAREQAEAKRKAEEKQRAEVEKTRLAKLETERKALEKKQAEEKARLAKLEAKRKAEEQRARKEAEAKRVAAEKAEAKRKAAEAAARAKAEQEARESALAEQMQAEQDARDRALAEAAIKSKVQRNWLQPPGTAEQGLKCTVRVRLGASGSVLMVSIQESSGNGAFDRSVEQAVYKADPLPMPTSPTLNAAFRDLEFIFDPSK